MNAADELFWDIAADLMATDKRVVEGTIMNGRCLRVGKEFLALVGYKEQALVLKLPKARVQELVEEGTGLPFGPGKKIFKEWVAIPDLHRETWKELLLEGIQFVAK